MRFQHFVYLCCFCSLFSESPLRLLEGAHGLAQAVECGHLHDTGLAFEGLAHLKGR